MGQKKQPETEEEIIEKAQAKLEILLSQRGPEGSCPKIVRVGKEKKSPLCPFYKDCLDAVEQALRLLRGSWFNKVTFCCLECLEKNPGLLELIEQTREDRLVEAALGKHPLE